MAHCLWLVDNIVRPVKKRLHFQNKTASDPYQYSLNVRGNGHPWLLLLTQNKIRLPWRKKGKKKSELYLFIYFYNEFFFIFYNDDDDLFE